MQDSLLVQRLEAKAHLQKVSQHGRLGQLSIALPAAPKHALEVTPLAVLHHDVDLVLARDEGVEVLDDVGALAETPVNVDFVQGLESFSFGHMVRLELLDDEDLPCPRSFTV